MAFAALRADHRDAEDRLLIDAEARFAGERTQGLVLDHHQPRPTAAAQGDVERVLLLGLEHIEGAATSALGKDQQSSNP